MLLHQIWHCNLAMVKSDEHTKLDLSSLTQTFIHYNAFKVIIRRKKQYENQVICISWTKKNNVMKEREGRYRSWVFFFILLVFCCSSNRLVHWDCLHSCTSGLRPLFGAHLSLSLTSVWYLREDTPPGFIHIPAQKIWDLGRVQVIFIYWLTYNKCFSLTHQRPAGRSIDCVCFFLIFSFLFLLPQKFISHGFWHWHSILHCDT